MKSPYIAFLKNLLIYSLILVLIYIMISYIMPEGSLSVALPFLFPFYIATTLISYFLIVKSLHNRFSAFVGRFMLITAIKLVWYALILIGYILLFSWDAIPFAINFLLLYLCYTTFETVALVRYSKTHSQHTTTNQS